MKVTPQPALSRSLDRKTEQTARDDRSNSDQAAPGSAATGRKFASVLDNVMRAPSEGDKDRPGDKSHKTAEADQPEHIRPEQKNKPLEEAEQEVIQALALDTSPARAPHPVLEITSPREILHIADLEKVTLTVRAQVVTGAQPQVILELPHSVLDSLRVKLSASGPGRITAEFLVRDETVKAQIDAHSTGLADMLRSRGINLETIKTSVSADLSGGNGSPDRRSQERRFEAPSPGVASRVNSAAQPANPSDTREADLISNTLYRA